MITGYKDFYYNVSNMEKAVNFYKTALQMNVGESDEYWTTLTLGNLSLGLHGNGGDIVPATIRNSHGQENGGTLTLASTNVTEDRARIEACGGKILGESEEIWGHMLAFLDLDGNVLKLMK